MGPETPFMNETKDNSMKNLSIILAGAALAAGLTIAFTHSGGGNANAHCQVPCGIYDDPARVTAMHEDAKTIEKAVAQINELAGRKDAQSQQQMARWVMNKESHASNIIDVMATYLLTQRVKRAAEGDKGRDAYLRKLADHHAVIVAAMKAKQNADPATVEALKKAITGLEQYYHKH